MKRDSRGSRDESIDRVVFPIGPHVHALQIKSRDAWLISAAIAWAYFAVFLPGVRSGVQAEDPFFPKVPLFLSIGVVVVRLWRYNVSGLWPPISILGRLAAGQWLIPGYDRALIAPLIVGLIFVAAQFLAVGVSIRDLAILSCSVFAVLLVGLGMGPGYREWILTAPGRLSYLRAEGEHTRQIL